MRLHCVFSIARIETGMLFRRKYTWLLTAVILFMLWFLLSPYNQPGLIYDANKFAPHALELSIIFFSLLMGFLISDRILRDEFLAVRECIMSKPIDVKDYILGKCLGGTLYCVAAFILPVWVMAQLEQKVCAGTEYFQLLPFVKAFAFFPLFSVFFIVGLSLCISTLLKDAMKFFVIFALLWCLVFFISTSNSQSPAGIVDFSGAMVERALFPLKYHPPTGTTYLIFALNLTFLSLTGLFSILVVSHHVAGEYSMAGSIMRRLKNNIYLGRSTQSRSLLWHNKNILNWSTFKGVLVLIIVLSALLVKGVAAHKLEIVRLYFEIVLPLIFSFTTAHIVLSDQQSNTLEMILSKPVSRSGLLLKRYLLLLIPNLAVAALLILVLRFIYTDMNVPVLLFASLSTVLFMCTLSMATGIVVHNARFGVVVSSLWLLFWIQGNVQNTIGTTEPFGLLNPYMYGFHPDSSLLIPGKLVLIVLSFALFGTAVLFLNKSERHI
jgi:ABC-type transport system involved in multi-copper enzyme maturation permease subunit